MTEDKFKKYGPMGGKFLILLDAGHYKPIPEHATWPKGRDLPRRLASMKEECPKTNL
jgi:hypothetical protein